MSSEAEDVIYKAAMTFKHEELAGMYSLCSKREQRHEKEIQRLQQQVKVLREALEYALGCMQSEYRSQLRYDSDKKEINQILGKEEKQSYQFKADGKTLDIKE